jgi:hypothetical protein
MLVKARLNQNKYDKLNSDLMKSMFDYFDVPEKEVDSILQSIY